MEFWPEFLASSWSKEFIAGGFGGVAGVLSGHPFDTLKTRLQQPSNQLSTFSLIRRMVANEGVSSFYKGMGTPLACVAFQNAVVFEVFAGLLRACKPTDQPEPAPLYSVAMAGAGTGALQSIILTPVELVKIRLQVSENMPNCEGPLSIARGIVRSEGIKGLFRGMGITILRDTPGHATYFLTYECTRESLHPGCRKTGQESFTTMLVAGGWAGVASWLCCYPMDVVKSRLQALSLSPNRSSPPRYSGMVDCFLKSLKEEGFKVFWHGLGATLTRAFVVNSAIFVAYETALRFLSENSFREADQSA